MKIRTYSELISFETIEQRFEYLRLSGGVGRETFGFDRYLNQGFYRSAEWRDVRRVVILRDLGCDLAVAGYEIHNRIVIHHMNPMTREDILEDSDDILNPEYLITTTHTTHNAIHYGTDCFQANRVVERRPGDTKLW